MPVFNKYEYEPLASGDLRLITLDQATDYAAPLSCQVSKVNINSSAEYLEYSAISYVWGPCEFSQTLEIHCDGDIQYLRVTQNLDTLLRNRSWHYLVSNLWIDAICLNQSDEEEKAQQLPTMGDIYKHATTVDIWLGPEEADTARLFDFFRRLSEVPDVSQWKRQWDMAGDIVELMKQCFDGPTVKTGFMSITNFFWRKWFTRRWIIQEACLATNAVVHCGRQTIPLDVITVAATRYQRMDMSDYGIKVAASIGPQTTKLTMLELLWHFHDAACLEPRDRIAALSSLATDRQRFHLAYTRHWTDIYKDFASYVLAVGNNNQRLQLLLHLFEFGPVKRTDPSYPSWVPDWSRSRKRRLPYNSGRKNFDTYEEYPHSPGHCGQSTVAFRDGAVCIHWNARLSRLRDYRVGFASRVGSSPEVEGHGISQAASVIQTLFPVIAEARTGIIALAALLDTAGSFGQTTNEIKQNSRALSHFEEAFLRAHPDVRFAQLLTSLRMLDSALRKFCLVELRPPDDGSGPPRGYGICSERLRVDDVLVPLWVNDGTRSDIHAAHLELQLSTMLAVRPVEAQGSEGQLYEGSGRVIGPVVCITFGDASTRGDWSVEGHVTKVVEGVLYGLWNSGQESSMGLI